jgi:hypothetical protein
MLARGVQVPWQNPSCFGSARGGLYTQRAGISGFSLYNMMALSQ